MSVFLLFNTKYYQVYIVNPMTITPYSISESTKISEAYIGTVNEASVKWDTQVVNDIVPIADKPKTAQDYIVPSVEQITRDNRQAQHAMRKIDDIFAPPVQRNPRQTYISAAPPSNRKQAFLHAPKRYSDYASDKIGQGVVDGLSIAMPGGAGVLGMAAKAGKVAKAAKGVSRFSKFVDGTGRAITGTGKFIVKHPKSVGIPLATVGTVYADQKLNDGKVTDGLAAIGKRGMDAVRTAYYDLMGRVPPEDQERFVNQQLMGNVINDERVLNYAEEQLKASQGKLSDNGTNELYSALSPYLGSVDDSRPYVKDFVQSTEKRKNLNEAWDENQFLKNIKAMASKKPVVVAPSDRSAFDNVTAKVATGQVNNQFPGVTLDPSAKSWGDNVKDFVFSNPYVTAGIITIPLITYIISKYGASLVNAIKGDGSDDKISGKEFVIVDNGKYLHSNGFSKTISKDIAIFKNNQDAQDAITTLNTVKPSNYKIEELEKAIS